MPIECSVEIAKLTTNVLKELDNVVMGHAFDSQNCLGRLADELIYQSDLAHRLSSTTRCDSYFPINAKRMASLRDSTLTKDSRVNKLPDMSRFLRVDLIVPFSVKFVGF